MSDHKADNHTDAAAAATTSTPHAPAPAAGHDSGKLTDLMAHGDKGKAPASRGPDLEQQAMRAAEQALAEGERAIATARAQLQQETPAATKKISRRELALRVLLAVNVLAMVIVAMLPAPGSSTTTKPVVEHVEHATGTEKIAPAPRTDELWVAAMAASSRHDYAAAVTLLERYLAESPRMAPSTQMAVLTALAYGASKANDWKRAQDYERRARAVEHAWQLRKLIRERHPELPLGGWANPAGDPARQVAFVADGHFTADFYLTQIVSHHRAGDVDGFLREAERQGITAPGVFGVFYYRSAKASTLRTLSQFLPVPVDELSAEFAAGATPVDVCARSIRELVALGARHFYVSNLPLVRTASVLNAILEKAGLLPHER